MPFSPLGGCYTVEKFSGLLGIEQRISIEELIPAPWSGGPNAADLGAVYQLMVILRGSEPAIWRRLLVQDTTLNRLSDFLIASMVWMGGHLHIFTAGGKRYSIPDPEWYDEDLMDDSAVKLGGIGGFYEFLEAIGDPAHPEHDRMLAWAGGNFDPELFDLNQANRALMAIGRGGGW